MQQVCHTLYTHNVSVSKHLRGQKNGGWMCPSTWKLDFTLSSIKIDYTSPPQPVPTTKMSRKNLN